MSLFKIETWTEFTTPIVEGPEKTRRRRCRNSSPRRSVRTALSSSHRLERFSGFQQKEISKTFLYVIKRCVCRCSSLELLQIYTFFFIKQKILTNNHKTFSILILTINYIPLPLRRRSYSHSALFPLTCKCSQHLRIALLDILPPPPKKLCFCPTK